MKRIFVPVLRWCFKIFNISPRDTEIIPQHPDHSYDIKWLDIRYDKLIKPNNNAKPPQFNFNSSDVMRYSAFSRHSLAEWMDEEGKRKKTTGTALKRRMLRNLFKHYIRSLFIDARERCCFVWRGSHRISWRGCALRGNVSWCLFTVVNSGGESA